MVKNSRGRISAEGQDVVYQSTLLPKQRGKQTFGNSGTHDEFSQQAVVRCGGLCRRAMQASYQYDIPLDYNCTTGHIRDSRA